MDLDKDQENQAWLACGLLLTQRFTLSWQPLPGGQWSWDRRGSALHCKTLACTCEAPSLSESLVALGKYAQNTVECELTACSTDRECVPLLQQAWQETVSMLSQLHLDHVLPQSPETEKKRHSSRM